MGRREEQGREAETRWGRPAAPRRRPLPTGRNRREQWRLLVMTFTLMAVISLMFEARDPRRWRWLWQITGTPEPSGAVEPSGGVEPSGAAEPSGGEKSSGTNEPAGSAELPTAEAERGRWTEVELMARLRELPWSLVRDNTVFRTEEQGAWFGTLEALRQVDPSIGSRMSAPVMSPIHMNQQMDAFRGHLVTVEGRLRRANFVKAPANESAIDGYWQIWCQTSADSDIPVVIYALEYPSGALRGMEIDVPARVTGVLFKRWTYLAADGIRISPLVLAAQVDLARPTVVRSAPPALGRQQVGWLAVTAVVSVAVSSIAYRWIRRGRRREPLPHRIELPGGTP
ncbi:MAG: hypothetical protein U0795_10110 [Pirellulales bacterium]